MKLENQVPCNLVQLISQMLKQNPKVRALFCPIAKSLKLKSSKTTKPIKYVRVFVFRDVCVSVLMWVFVKTSLQFFSQPVFRSSRLEKIMGIHRESSTTVSFISLNFWIQKGSYCRCFYANFQKFQNRFFRKRVLLKKVCKIRTFFQIKNTAVSAEFAMGSKFHFSQLKTYLSQFIDWFLKFEKTSFIMLTLKCDQLCDQLGLCKFPISFSSKLKLGHNFSQFIHIVKNLSF